MFLFCMVLYYHTICFYIYSLVVFSIFQADYQQPLNATPVDVVQSSVTVSSKVSSITTNNENEGVSIRSDEVTGKSSTDGSATSAISKGSSLSLDALAKAKKALQLKKELSEKLKKLPEVRNHCYFQSVFIALISLFYIN
jgi:hypothetical protein